VAGAGATGKQDGIMNVLSSKEIKTQYKSWIQEAEIQAKSLAPGSVNRYIDYWTNTLNYSAPNGGKPDPARHAESAKTLVALRKQQEKLIAESKGNPYNDVELERLSANHTLGLGMAIEGGKKNQIGIGDGEGNLQAALNYSVKKDHIYVDELTTAPWNLISKDPRSVRGAGTRAIAETVKLSLAKGKKGVVDLYALESAVPFYKKLGFQSHGSDPNSMRLSPENAQKLLDKLGL